MPKIKYAPTDASENPSYVLVYTGSQLDTVTMTLPAGDYVKTLTYTGTNLTSVSGWVRS
jgi:hypothetical protein